ncbi:hypothetical protein GCM10027614_49940 [Micromonospora vulcania]
MSQMNRRRALQLLAALGTTGFAAGCGSDTDGQATSNRGPIKIGLIAPRAGGFKSIGDDITNGFQLFLDLHDQRLGGHPVTLLTADEGDTAKTGKAAVDDLLKQGVLALTGVVNSSVMVNIRDTVEQARVPLIGSNASPSSLQSVVYIWRTSYVLDEAGRAMGRYLRDQLPANARVAIIVPENVGSPDVVRGFRQAFGATDPRIADPVTNTDATATPGKTTYVSDIKKALAKKPTAVFCFYAGTAAVEFIKQLRDQFSGPIYAPGFHRGHRAGEHAARRPGHPDRAELLGRPEQHDQPGLRLGLPQEAPGHPDHLRDGVVRRGAGARPGDPADRR